MDGALVVLLHDGLAMSWNSAKLRENHSHSHQISECMIKHIIIRLTYVNVWESMGKPCSCMQFIKSRISATSHTRICINTTSQVRIRIRYYKSRVLKMFMKQKLHQWLSPIVALEVISEHLLFWGSMPPDSQAHTHSFFIHSSHSEVSSTTIVYWWYV